ncbi:P-loop containing nucleoside triphosphate hydrolase protein [Phellopilus nigrolimitatus]|nr:P-loop containing nucleoside triphosphate hydrolase protein [Phellopilus nigrolimitatus]
MVGFGLASSSGDHSASSFRTSNKIKTIPPPLASSTPKKRTNGGPNLNLNGVRTPPSLKKAKRYNFINGASNADGSPLKRRKTSVAYMEDDEEDHGASFASINGHTTGFGANQSGKLGKATNSQEKELRKLAALQEQRQQLPIAKGREALIREFRENDTVVLVGETGSGKTTQVPQYILEADICGSGQIAVTQPRRVAATTLAQRVAEEQGVVLGSRVGYAVRFNEAHGPGTKIKFLTDGMLARELLADPLLSRYSVIVVDEAHERTLNTDLLIASLKTIQRERNGRSGKAKAPKGKGKGREDAGPLKVIIMSATLDADKFSRFFNNAKVLYVKGRQHPVKIYHTLAIQTDYVDAAIRTFFQIHVDHPPGDVLIFLPGQEDIESLDKAITTYAAQLPIGQMNVLTCPMYASLPQSQQSRVFQKTPAGTRKCILSTNIAETSITIPGVRYVIDTGKHKEKRHFAGHAGGGLDSLQTQDVSKSSAMQRAGRAGREGPGECFRLYTESDFMNLEDAAIPEIQRCSLMSSFLQLKCLGLDLQTLDFMDKPDEDSISAAMKSLFLLGALSDKSDLTHVGRQMNNFPLEPPYARALLTSCELGCTSEMLGIVSVLSAPSKLFFDSTEQREDAADARALFRHASGDHLTALAVLRAYEELVSGGAGKRARREWCRLHFVNERTLSEAVKIQAQMRGICERQGVDWAASCGGDDRPVLRSLLSGLTEHVARLRSEGGYVQMFGKSADPPSCFRQVVKIHPGSVLSNRKAPLIVYDELVLTGSTYARGVSVVDSEMVTECTPVRLRTAF